MDSISFVHVDLNASWIQQLNSIYEEYHIYRSIIVTDDIDTSNVIQSYLDTDNYSYYIPSSKDFENEFKNFIISNNRILIIRYDDFINNYQTFLNILNNQHNLLILENLESFQEKIILDHLKSSIHTGFLKSNLPYFIWVN